MNYQDDFQLQEKYGIKVKRSNRLVDFEILALYCLRKGIVIPFGDGSSYRREDSLSLRPPCYVLAQQCISSIGHEWFEETLNLIEIQSAFNNYRNWYENLASNIPESFNEDYPSLLLCLIKQTSYGDPYTSKLAETIAQITKAEGYGEIISHYFSPSLCLALDSGISYFQEDSDNFPYANVFSDAFGLKPRWLKTIKGTGDKVAVVLENQEDVLQSYISRFKVYEGQLRKRYLLLVPNLSLSTLPSRFKDSLLNRTRKIVDTFSAPDEGYVAVLSATEKTDRTYFQRLFLDEIVPNEHLHDPVPHDDIRQCDYSLNPASYILPDTSYPKKGNILDHFMETDSNNDDGSPVNPDEFPELKEAVINFLNENFSRETIDSFAGGSSMPEKKLISIGELCFIDNDCSRSTPFSKLPHYDYSTDFKRICENARHPKYDNYNSEVTSLAYDGPHVHVRYGEGTAMQVFVSSSPGKYHCPRVQNYALSVRDNKISLEYLAHVLMTDLTFLNFAATNPSPEVFLRRKIAIIPDREQQDEYVSQFLDLTEDVVRSDARYRLIWVDPDISTFLDDKDNFEQLQQWQIDQIWMAESVFGEKSLSSGIVEKADEVDAVIINASTDMVSGRLKGLRRALELCRKYDKPLYVYSDIPADDMELDLSDDEFTYISSGRNFVKSNPASLMKMITALRQELDGRGIAASEMMGKYVREFESAKWVDATYPDMHLASDLRFVLSQPNKSLNKLRGMTRSLLSIIVKEIAAGSGIDDADLGAIPKFLEDKFFSDSKVTMRTYTIEGEVMPKTLAHSLVYANELLNSASHTETISEEGNRMDVSGYISSSHSEHISESLINIFLEFLLWFRTTGGKFAGYCKSKGLNERRIINSTGTLVHVKGKEYFCHTESDGDIHILVSPNFNYIEGTEITIVEIFEEKNLRDKYSWCSPSNGWYINKQ